MHSCHIEVISRSKDIIKIAKEFPRLTRESMVRQKGKQQLEQSCSAAVTTVKNYTDKSYIDNIKRKEKTKNKGTEKIKILKTTFEKEDPYLVYSFNDGSDED